MDVWLETVPALLEHLHVEHVSLVSHSAGTIYSLNTLSQFRDILDPVAPYAAYLGPWVHFENSHLALWSTAAKLPDGIFSYWSKLNQFVAQRVMPATSWSSGMLTSSSGFLRGQPSDVQTRSSEYAQDVYGVDYETGQSIDKLMTKYIFAEGLTGANDEARLMLKKAREGAQGVCENYMQFTSSLAEKEKERQKQKADGTSARLRVRLHFAESDLMSGEEGRKYFEKCWTQEGISDSVDVETVVWPGTNHDSVLADFRKGALKTVFEEIGRLRGA